MLYRVDPRLMFILSRLKRPPTNRQSCYRFFQVFSAINKRDFSTPFAKALIPPMYHSFVVAFHEFFCMTSSLRHGHTQSHHFNSVLNEFKIASANFNAMIDAANGNAKAGTELVLS